MRNFTFLPLATALVFTSSVAYSQRITETSTPPREEAQPSATGLPSDGTITEVPAPPRPPAQPKVSPPPPNALEIQFEPATHLHVAAPRAAALGDIDRDGDLDLVVTSNSPERVVIFGNRGDGTFTLMNPVMLPAGSQPHTPVVCDLDGDSDLDIAVTLSGHDAVQTVINNGLGMFSSPGSIPVGDDPRSIAFADLDNDNDIELVVANRGSGTVSILRNQGFLAFTVTHQTVASGLRDVALGDFDHDLLPDIAVASVDAQQVSVLRNLGAGNFGAATNLKGSSGLRPECIVTADLDRNGTIDIAASSSANGEDVALLFFNQGGGIFSPQPVEIDLQGQGIAGIDAADLNLDNDVDVATAASASNKVVVLVNKGAGQFLAQASADVNPDPRRIEIGDLNRDNLPDIVTTNEASNSVSILLNDSPGIGCSVLAYGQSKINSAGTTALIGWQGVASATTQNFELRLRNALPSRFGGAFYGTNGPTDVPFMGGRLLVQGPLHRLPTQLTDANGSMSYLLQVTPDMSDTTRWFQFWYRDPASPDGFTLATSNALEVTFCD